MSTIDFQNDILPLKNELFRLALRITQNRADAEDVVQDTMLKVWKRREEWSQIDNIEAFCLTICRNLALDHNRRMSNNERTLSPSAPSTAFSGSRVVSGSAADIALSASTALSGSTVVSGSAADVIAVSTAPTPEALAIIRDRLQLVRRLIDLLPEKQRSCLQLRDIEGKSYRDIATILDITEQQVKVNIFRARQTIKSKFKE